MSGSDTRESLLVSAKELFLSRGFSGTSVDMICEQAGTSKGSLYHFFKSKEELGVAVLQWSLERSTEILGEGDHMRITDPEEQAFAYLRHMEASSETLWSGGCLLGTFANELADTHPRLQAEVVSIFDVVATDMAERLEPLATRLGGTPSAAELADQFLIILEGSITLAKAYRDPARIPRGIRLFRESLESLLAQPEAFYPLG